LTNLTYEEILVDVGDNVAVFAKVARRFLMARML
jgi:hypothetical protein